MIKQSERVTHAAVAHLGNKAKEVLKIFQTLSSAFKIKKKCNLNAVNMRLRARYRECISSILFWWDDSIVTNEFLSSSRRERESWVGWSQRLLRMDCSSENNHLSVAVSHLILINFSFMTTAVSLNFYRDIIAHFLFQLSYCSFFKFEKGPKIVDIKKFWWF